jgi:hypothetical protein
MPAEATRMVMVLAVHVVGDRAAHRQKPGPRRHRQKPGAAVGLRPAQHGQNIGQLHTGFAGQNAGLPVEIDEPVEVAAIDQRAAGIERHIAVGSAASIGPH